MITSRRLFLTGLSASLAAPAIVRAASLMPVKALHIPQFETRYIFPSFPGQLLPDNWRYLVRLCNIHAHTTEMTVAEYNEKYIAP